MIEVHDLTVTYDGCDVLHKATLTVPDGAHIALMGKPGESFSPTLSIGATPTHAGDTAYRDVFARADEALYQAKHAGKNRLRIRR